MKQNYRHIRDIIGLFFLTISILFLIIPQNNQNGEPHIQSYNGFSPGLNSVSAKKKKKTKNSYITRKYNWIDYDKKKRETLFKIQQSHLKKEIKKFGLNKGMNITLFMRSRGFKVFKRLNQIINGKIRETVVTIVDYKNIFNRNKTYFHGLTKQLIDSFPDNKYDPVFSFLKFVQYIPYRRPPVRYSGRFIGKFFIPLVCLYEQYGDCDSKSLLLSEFLATYPNSKEKLGLLLIHGQGLAHAVLAVKKKPLIGMSSIFVKGSGYYILLETTHHNWSPGFLSHRVSKIIKAGYIKFISLN